MSVSIKAFLLKNKIKQIEISSKTDIPLSTVNQFVMGWKPLPDKHVGSFAKYVGLTEGEVRLGRVKSSRV